MSSLRSWSSWGKYRFRSKTPSKFTPESTERESESLAAQRGLRKEGSGFPRPILPLAHRPQNKSGAQNAHGGITVTRHTDMELSDYSELRSTDMASMYHSYTHEHSSQRNLVTIRGNV